MDFAKYFLHAKMKIRLFVVVLTLIPTELTSLVLQVRSALLGCVIAEHSSIINCGETKCSESFVMHLLRMIVVCTRISLLVF